MQAAHLCGGTTAVEGSSRPSVVSVAVAVTGLLPAEKGRKCSLHPERLGTEGDPHTPSLAK